MIKQTDKSLFMASSEAALYQLILKEAVSYETLGRSVINQIKMAHAFRQVEQVRELSTILTGFPIKEYRLIGQYYLVWCDCRKARYDIEHLEGIIDQTATFKVKALSSRGTFEWYKGNNESAMVFYNEALKASPTISEHIDLSKGIAVLKSQEGFRKSALKDLEDLLPIIRYAEPLTYYEFLNSYAVELGESGQIEQAIRICDITLASPFAPYYKEWSETRDDLIGKRQHSSRMFVPALKFESDKVLRYDWSARARQASPGETKAEVRKITERDRFEMAKKNAKKEEEDYAHLEKRAELHRIIADPDTTGEELDELLKRYEELKGKQTEQK